MPKFFIEILDWSEVWSIIIPLVFYFWYSPKAKWIRPLFIFLVLALILNFIIDFTWKSPQLGLENLSKNVFGFLYIGEKKELYTVILYTFNSIFRFLLITWLFFLINPVFKRIYRITLYLFIAFVLINFIYFENIVTSFSSRLLTVEAAIILFYSLLFFYSKNMNDDIPSLMSLSTSWVVFGLTLYSSVNFPIFLFYKYLSNTEINYAIDVWSVHNLLYIVLMISIAIAFKKTM